MNNTKVPGRDSLIWTMSGKSFDLFTPPQEFSRYRKDFNIDDIARGLSHICRWGGQVSRFYSVAQHCLMTARVLEMAGKRELMHAGLVHDAPEAYIDDMQRPLTIHFPEYQEIEDRLEAALMPILGAPVKKPPEVKTVDSVLAWCEANELGLVHVFDDPLYAEFRDFCIDFTETLGVNPADLVPDMSPEDAREEWRAMFMATKPGHVHIDAQGFIRTDAANPGSRPQKPRSGLTPR